MSWRERIIINPMVCSGKACIKDTRVMVSVVLDNLAEGESYESIMEGYRVTRDDILAAIAFAAELAADRHVPLGPGVPDVLDGDAAAAHAMPANGGFSLASRNE